MIPNHMAIIPVNLYQRAAMQAVITVEDKIRRGKRLCQYPYARELLRELYGNSRKISAADVHNAAGRYDHEARKSASKDDIIRALDTLIESNGELCPYPLSNDHGYLYFPEVRYRLRERHYRKFDLKVSRKLRNEERKRQQKRRRYQVDVAQAQVELAFITPAQLGAWYKRQARYGIDDDNLALMVLAWSKRFTNMPSKLDLLAQPLWAIVKDVHGELESRSVIEQWLDELMLSNKLENKHDEYYTE
ncbi:protein PsiA [Serratia sp. S1B]|nr:protein PsiA [Serratia sp. S1B]